ncbi:hypothetical protein HJG60_011380 [Phyllostomus discolor]|uniref:Uncharacterized protein n=1 Tax=Phyllostomus discolor TaxID=89673 RepID=A0A834A7T2_9CHIR|nr:hypothetical protein HJG60_011380 [Phyllostomus discolor]
MDCSGHCGVLHPRPFLPSELRPSFLQLPEVLFANHSQFSCSPVIALGQRNLLCSSVCPLPTGSLCPMTCYGGGKIMQPPCFNWDNSEAPPSSRASAETSAVTANQVSFLCLICCPSVFPGILPEGTTMS